MIYYLNTECVPTIPVPHDCIIKKVSIQEDYIIFEFEDDISYLDSIRYINPEAKSLIIKIHLIDIYTTHKMKHYRTRWCKETYACIKNSKLIEFAGKGRLEYLYHYVGFQSIIIKLFCNAPITLDICADYVEYEWIV